MNPWLIVLAYVLGCVALAHALWRGNTRARAAEIELANRMRAHRDEIESATTTMDDVDEIHWL